ncbi:MAG: hypothetical protein ACD_69C00184G0003 [uncultured bacterium]|nr:MAG: hypothetical protein ACD_69C00184G0003 [uncultured bacterium]OGT09451.1 MAG: hypothetical protein A2V89_02975 [Gammaproteobacteria bacterium RBG_16_37_9]HBC71498.1 TIGR02449 family protein [Coxiellaceae bacterium]HBY55497.1 TIGR02449 family protein [Coxiellaceae bacterium]
MELELNDLESRIDKLIELLQQVKLENHSLRKKIATTNNENITLLDKNKKIAESIRKLILQLKDEFPKSY